MDKTNEKDAVNKTNTDLNHRLFPGLCMSNKMLGRLKKRK